MDILTELIKLLNKDILELSNKFYYNKIKLNEMDFEFNNFINLFRKLLNLKNYEILKLNKNFLFLNGFLKFKNEFYYFSILRIDNFSLEKNGIYFKKVKSNLDYYSKSNIIQIKDFFLIKD